MQALLSPQNHLLALARSGRRSTHPILAVVVSVCVVFLAAVLGGGVAQLLLLPLLPSPWGMGALLVIAFGLMYLFLGAWLHWFEGRAFATLGFERPGALARIGRGAALGVAMFALTLLLVAMLGGVALARDPQQSTGLAALGAVLVALVGYCVQGPAEEVIFRGWLLPAIGARSQPWIGVAVSSLLFAVFHGLNPGITLLAFVNLALFGLFLALWALAEGGLWGVCAWHALWNWSQGSLFGLQVSGNEVSPSLLALQPVGAPLVSGGEFGVEASVVATVVLLLGSLAAVLVARRGAALHTARGGRVRDML